MLAQSPFATKARITKRLVDQAFSGNRERFVWDTDVTGFGLRIQPSGSKSYVVKYRAGSGRCAPTRRMTLGATGKLTPDQARTSAKKILGSVAHGADPAVERIAERRAETLQQISELFLAEHVTVKLKPGTAALYKDILDRLVLPELGSRKAAKVTTSEVARLHVRMHDHPYQANRMLAIVGSVYSFAAKRKILTRDINPSRGIERYRESGRERFLTAPELVRLGDAIREGETVGLPYEINANGSNAKHARKPENRRTVLDPHAAAALRLLILTGARLREILGLRWDWVDLERGLLLLPDSKTRQEGDRTQCTCDEGAFHPAPHRVICNRRQVGRRRLRKAARGFATAMECGGETRGRRAPEHIGSHIAKAMGEHTPASN